MLDKCIWQDIKTVFLFLMLNHNCFKNSFFLSIEWNSLDYNIRNFGSLALFKKYILAFIRPSPNSTFYCRNPNSLSLIRKLRLGLSHIQFHKFKHSFQDTLNSVCNCGIVKATIHYLLHCLKFSNQNYWWEFLKYRRLQYFKSAYLWLSLI